MSIFERIIYEGDTDMDHYQVVDMIYEGRPARILFSGERKAAQSGLARDDRPEMLFDYNQRFLELVTALRPKKLLLIGGGAYTLPMLLLKKLPDIQIDVIELDPGLDEIAERYFHFREDERLRIMHADGRDYINTNTKRYDMILIDAFTHAVIPRVLSTVQAVTHLRRSLARDGIVAVNIIGTYMGRASTVLREQCAAYQAVFDMVELFPADNSFSDWQSQNYILTARKNKAKPLHCLRYQAVAPLETKSSEALLDEQVKND